MANNQLKAITLSVLGTLFYHTKNEQAEKMLRFAYISSKNAHNEIGCLVAGLLLKGMNSLLNQYFSQYYNVVFIIQRFTRSKVISNGMHNNLQPINSTSKLFVPC